MKNYINQLRHELNVCSSDIKILQKENNIDIINDVIKNIIGIESLRTLGAFFTPQALAKNAVNQFSTAITAESKLLDPNCGVGNLLIEATMSLGVQSSLSATLKIWNEVLYGFDIECNFIVITKLRLILAALARGVKLDCSIEQAESYLTNIKLKNALDITAEDISHITHLLMNPPFLRVDSPTRDYWKKGKVNSAGVFFDYYLRLIPVRCDVVAILPDVLRSGSRYSGFRQFVSENLVGKSAIWGRFSMNADVDVFVLSGIKEFTHSKIEWVKSADEGKPILADEFNVSVGAVVPYRDKQIGEKYPYFHPKNCKNWAIINTAEEYRHFSGKTFQSPCILIKRTSSPSDKFRAAATLIRLNEPIAVENHLIVVTPKDGSLRSCKRLLKVLAKAQTSQFLNEQIRARHLTIGAVKSIPID